MTLRKKTGLDSDEQDCFNGDISARQMGGQGVDVILSPHAKNLIPFNVEAKRTEKLNIWAAIKQAESNTEEGRTALVVFRRNSSKTYAVLEFDKLLELI